jgi:hypothetical protein
LGPFDSQIIFFHYQSVVEIFKSYVRTYDGDGKVTGRRRHRASQLGESVDVDGQRVGDSEDQGYDEHDGRAACDFPETAADGSPAREPISANFGHKLFLRPQGLRKTAAPSF